MKVCPKKTIQFNNDSPPYKKTSPTKPSSKSVVQEMGFTDKTPQYQACVKFFKAIRSKIKDKNQDNPTEIIDLNSPVDSPVKDKIEILFDERKDELENIEKEKEDETTHEEHEKQVENDNNNEKGVKSQQTRTVT